MKTKQILSFALALSLAALTLTGCSSSSSTASSADASVAGTSTAPSTATSSKTEIKYSKSQGPYSELFESAIKPILEKEGYKLTGINFSDLLQADQALNDGEVDFNVEQHTAYMNDFNSNQKGHLVAISPIPTVPAGIFSSTHKSLDEIKDGAKIAVPNDASNTSRAYVLLQKAGFIKLKDGADLSKVTQQDVAENKHNIQFTEMKSLNIPSVESDFDYIVITGSIIYNAKIDASTALSHEDVLDHLVLQLVVQDKNKDAKWAKDIAAAYHSQELKDYMAKNNKGLWFIPKELQ